MHIQKIDFFLYILFIYNFGSLHTKNTHGIINNWLLMHFVSSDHRENSELTSICCIVKIYLHDLIEIAHKKNISNFMK